MYKLYDFLRSGNCYKIRLLLHQLGIDYERINIDILNKESRTLEFLKINSNGRVPVLEHAGKRLAESNAILWYLATDTDLLFEDKYQQSLVLQWMFFEQFSHEPNIAAPRYWVSILKAENEYREKLKDKMKAGYVALDVMEQHLQKNIFLLLIDTVLLILLYTLIHMLQKKEILICPDTTISKHGSKESKLRTTI